jgi:transglutaminase-like putative cysteine protease
MTSFGAGCNNHQRERRLALEWPMSAGSLVDHREVAWNQVRWTAYLVYQSFRYAYPSQIFDLRHRLIIIPPERHGDQRLITHRLEISSPTTEVRRDVDAFGNLVLSLAIDQVVREIDFTAWIVVERDATLGAAGPIIVSAETYADRAFRDPSVMTEPDDALRTAAERFTPDAADGLRLATAINTWVYKEMRYAHGETGVRTTAAAAFAQRCGVCQDYAHIMVALCRLHGLPARYVSGHLLGEGGTHAWVEVLLPDPKQPGRYLARPFDPTHGVEPGLNYLTVAIGRDYADVAPTSGTYRATVSGNLTARKHVGVTAVEYFTQS